MGSAPHTLIVGGGLAGLACARELGSACTLLEAEDRLGGLCRTDVESGFSFDWTGHWLHARDPGMRQLIAERWLAGNLTEVERRAVVYSEHVFTQFPYQFNLHGLPAQTIADCLVGFCTAQHRGDFPLRNADDFVVRHLGEGFAQRFMRPYNEKLFTVPCTGLSPEWGGRFIPRPTLKQVVDGALGIVQAGAGYNATFWYPREGGIESLVRGIVRDLSAPVRLSARVAAIDLARRHLRLTSGEELSYERLVLTTPLSLLSRALPDAPEKVALAAASLRSVSVTVIEIGADDVAGGERFHWAYFPETRFPFYRVGSPSEVNSALAPPGCRSFAVEFAHRGPIDIAQLKESALRGLEECGLLDRNRVRVVRARTIPVAYVLFDHDHAAARETVLGHLAEHGVQVAGRYGKWEYSSMEDALLSGRDAAQRIATTPRTPQ